MTLGMGMNRQQIPVMPGQHLVPPQHPDMYQQHQRNQQLPQYLHHMPLHPGIGPLSADMSTFCLPEQSLAELSATTPLPFYDWSHGFQFISEAESSTHDPETVMHSLKAATAGPAYLTLTGSKHKAVSQFRVGQKIETHTHRTGIVRYVGPIHIAEGPWLGIDLQEPTGKNDGSVRGERYFECAPLHGLFVKETDILQILDDLVYEQQWSSLRTAQQNEEATFSGFQDFAALPLKIPETQSELHALEASQLMTRSLDSKVINSKQKPPSYASLLHRMFAWLRKLMRPRLNCGYRRIEWQCVSWPSFYFFQRMTRRMAHVPFTGFWLTDCYRIVVLISLQIFHIRMADI
jgi:hypothetical protein